jgi:hypothetical protein
MHECNQVDRLERIELDMQNHKEWRDKTTIQLTNIEIHLATANERLKAKLETFDEHVKGGNAFRGMLLGQMCAFAIAAFAASYAYGGLMRQVDINTEKWKALETNHDSPRYSTQAYQAK